MYSGFGNWYQLSQRDKALGLSQKSSEESVANSHHTLEPIVEENFYLNSTSRMAKVLEYLMAFNMRLAFVKTNGHKARPQ